MSSKKSSQLHGEQRCHQLNAVPQVLDAQILVEAVLIVRALSTTRITSCTSGKYIGVRTALRTHAFNQAHIQGCCGSGRNHIGSLGTNA